MKANPNLNAVSLVLFMMLLMTACNKDEGTDNTKKTGDFELSITDAPVDDPGIKSTIITVTGIELDGTRFNFDNEVQFDIMAYQRGDTKVLFDEKIQTGTYSDLALILKAGELNNQPACYLETKDGIKHDLFTGISGEVKFDVKTADYKVDENTKSRIVMDFNLRNAIRQSVNSGADKYNFNSDYSDIIRAENISTTLKVSGKVSDPLDLGGDRIVAYLYVKGEFDKTTETSISGSNGIMFENALCSDAVDASGNFEFNFITKNNYEVVLVAYENNDSDSELEVKGFLTTNLLGILGIDINAQAGTNINTNMAITGFLLI